MLSKIMSRSAAAAVALTLGMSAAHAATLDITITNNSGQSGLSLTPLYVAFHNGSFTGFTAGTAASNGIEQLAEEGNFMPLRDERQGVAPTSQGGVLTAPGSPFTENGIPPVIEPGETATIRVDVDSANRYFNYFSMVIPSNDLFIGQEGLGEEIFDIAGNYLGNRTFNVVGGDVWDAGTEVNNNQGAAFNTAGGFGTDENGVVTRAGSSALNVLTGQTGANSLTIGGSPVSLLATITISEVPLPAGAPLILAGLGAFGFLRSRQKKA